MESKEKPIRDAVRCILIEDGKVIVTKYKEPNKKAGYYEIPGGKIEEGETAEDAAIREFKEETGITVYDLKRKGHMMVEYPNRIYSFEVFVSYHYEGKPMDFVENSSEWIEINEVLKKKNKLAGLVLIDPFFKEIIEDNTINFSMAIVVDEQERIQKMTYELGEN